VDVPTARASLLVAFATAVVATPICRAAALRWNWLDLPNARSSHSRAVPRGGGLAIIAAVAVVMVWRTSTWIDAATDRALLGGGIVLAGIGLADDRRGLSPFTRLAGQIVVAAVLASIAGGLDRLPLPSPLDLPLARSAGIIVAVVWILAVVNFYNFMDGIDGLAALQAVVTGTGIALAAWDPFASLLALALAGACAGFLVFNWAPARIFLGDVGSGAIGFCFAALPLLAPPHNRSQALFLVAVSLWLFLADPSLTLAMRVLRGARWYEAHREHLYQRLVISGLTHRQVTLAVGSGAALLTLTAVDVSRRSLSPWISLTVAMTVFAAEIAFVLVRERRCARSVERTA
jgi:Fuc2NAc and GlcNAc transferase